MLNEKKKIAIPVGTQTLILSKHYYGVLSKNLEQTGVERYYSILYYIYHNDGCCCQQDICDKLAVDKTAMVKVLDNLGKQGLVERKVNPADRRQHVIRLTKKGKEQTKIISKVFSSVEKKMFRNIADADREVFNRVLEQVKTNLKAMPSNDLFFNYKKTN